MKSHDLGELLLDRAKAAPRGSAGASSNPARDTNNQGTTTGPKGALKNGKTTPNINLPGRSR